MIQLSDAQRIVVKIGSALVSEGGLARTEWLSKLAADIDVLNQQGKQVILVSSGAIALGRKYLGDRKPRKLEEKQAAAALGQPPLMAALAEAFAPYNLPVAQALLTLEDTENRRRWLNARATLDTLLKAGALPVINENDTVATDEIRYGDNDRLAARVAQMIGADVLVLLSDIDGLYTANPQTDPTARHVPSVPVITADIEAMGGDANSEAAVGSGGMITKLAAAKIAYAAGCATVITLGNREHPLLALSQGARATWITPPYNPETARETWLRSHLNPEGEITIDAGAERALANGSSLLPVGITGVSQGFARGAAVAIKGQAGSIIGKGITAYSAADIERVKGLQTDAVEAVLGFRGRPAIVHRDDLILG